MHGQSVIGKTGQHIPALQKTCSYGIFTAKTIEIDALRFQDKDLASVGTLEYGQFGVVCLPAFCAIDC
jgi:hypothetical protein